MTESELKTKFFFLRDRKGNPVGCVATVQLGDRVRVGVSACNPLDQFNKLTGKGIALFRAITSPAASFARDPNRNIKLDLMHWMMGIDSIPTRLHQAARRWIKGYVPPVEPTEYVLSSPKPEGSEIFD